MKERITTQKEWNKLQEQTYNHFKTTAFAKIIMITTPFTAAFAAEWCPEIQSNLFIINCPTHGSIVCLPFPKNL